MQIEVPEPSKSGSRACIHRSRRFWIIFFVTILLAVIGLAIGLGVGLTQKSALTSTPSAPTSTSFPPSNTNGTFWQPSAGTTWQIVLLDTLKNTATNVSVYDIDLFENPASIIDILHAQNRRVICYFSAGTFEPNRPDSAQFTAKEKGKELSDWPGEYWIDTRSSNVRNTMTSRLQLAKSKGCDGVDPDNIDAYDNPNGLDLTASDAVDYLTFLAGAAHEMNMSIGLKNGGAIVGNVIGLMQWEVNEQCGQFKECELFQPFISANKPVFRIEYVEEARVDATAKKSICDLASAHGFSTVIKENDLDDWIEAC